MQTLTLLGFIAALLENVLPKNEEPKIFLIGDIFCEPTQCM